MMLYFEPPDTWICFLNFLKVFYVYSPLHLLYMYGINNTYWGEMLICLKNLSEKNLSEEILCSKIGIVILYM